MVQTLNHKIYDLCKSINYQLKELDPVYEMLISQKLKKEHEWVKWKSEELNRTNAKSSKVLWISPIIKSHSIRIEEIKPNKSLLRLDRKLIQNIGKKKILIKRFRTILSQLN